MKSINKKIEHEISNVYGSEYTVFTSPDEDNVGITKEIMNGTKKETILFGKGEVFDRSLINK